MVVGRLSISSYYYLSISNTSTLNRIRTFRYTQEPWVLRTFRYTQEPWVLRTFRYTQEPWVRLLITILSQLRTFRGVYLEYIKRLKNLGVRI